MLLSALMMFRETALTQIYAVLAFLFPLSIYTLVVAELNRRPAPVLVRGTWDTIGLLFASSGFFLFSAPMIFDEFWFRHWLIWILYYSTLAAGAIYLVLWRAQKTMIYNVDPELCSHRLQRVLSLLGLDAKRHDNQLTIVPGNEGPRIEESGFIETLPIRPLPNPDDHRFAELEIETFPALCHVTLHWGRCSTGLRDEIETELVKGLPTALPEDNPIAGWLLTVSGLIFGVLLMVVAASCLLSTLGKRWI